MSRAKERIWAVALFYIVLGVGVAEFFAGLFVYRDPEWRGVFAQMAVWVSVVGGMVVGGGLSVATGVLCDTFFVYKPNTQACLGCGWLFLLIAAPLVFILRGVPAIVFDESALGATTLEEVRFDAAGREAGEPALLGFQPEARDGLRVAYDDEDWIGSAVAEVECLANVGAGGQRALTELRCVVAACVAPLVSSTRPLPGAMVGRRVEDSVSAWALCFLPSADGLPVSASECVQGCTADAGDSVRFQGSMNAPFDELFTRGVQWPSDLLELTKTGNGAWRPFTSDAANLDNLTLARDAAQEVLQRMNATMAVDGSNNDGLYFTLGDRTYAWMAESPSIALGVGVPLTLIGMASLFAVIISVFCRAGLGLGLGCGCCGGGGGGGSSSSSSSSSVHKDNDSSESFSGSSEEDLDDQDARKAAFVLSGSASSSSSSSSSAGEETDAELGDDAGS